ncbi:sulfite exporter TauE/SafE family protein [Salmonella enterica subsp. diarizonae]|nr:sulfite exporter TauE/SafE family protein [Salmonella enterica]ECJ4483604.1 sulfite exporter TauE/SafE family protein [Salmonella enterica subsp. diarizonae]EDV3183271.1 sulfite exporter TauE/SafE family protein [Salmonella enterica subsp. diarizonae]EIU5650593.1 sulfite exporter TauE/SafE family protein [Salmonella enterica]EKF6405344.1 sulfite exporter TauE/SafE family protein [Salmonella enterica]
MVWLTGLIIGVLMGLTGAGGGILAVPALMFILDLPITKASPLALIAVSAAAVIGACIGLETRYRAALLMAVSGMPFTWPGIWTAAHVSHTFLVFIFSFCMLLVAYRFLVPREKSNKQVLCEQSSETGRLIWHWYSVLAVAAVGALSGFATGLLGVGGGFIIVPALKRLTRLSMASVTATSLCVISLTGGTAVLAARQNGMLVFDTTAGAFLAAVCLGLLAGRWGVQRLPGNSVSHIFGGLLVIVALSMLISTMR